MRWLLRPLAIILLVLMGVSGIANGGLQTVRMSPPLRYIASWYGPRFHGKRMSNGQTFNQRALTVAHRTLPFGTRLLLRNKHAQKSVVATVTDRGPYIKGRQLDVSQGVAKRLGFERNGVVVLEARVLR